MRLIHHISSIVLTFLLLGAPLLVQAQDQAAAEVDMPTEVIWTLLLAAVLLAAACAVLASSIFVLINSQYGQQTVTETKVDPETGETVAVAVAATATGPSFWTRFMKKMTDAVPVAKESSIDMGHDYDGIRELDNNLPPWWKYGFYFTIVLGIFYFLHFHVFEIGFMRPILGDGISSQEEYAIAMEEAEVQKAAYLAKVANGVNENSVTLLADAASLSEGAAIYKTSCVVCHGDQGQGGIGPNLADEYWLHGGGIKDIFRTIKYGVPEKGMIPWQTQLKPKEMQAVSSYIMGMTGTTPPNPKEPQGEKYTPPAENEETPADSTGVAMN